MNPIIKNLLQEAAEWQAKGRIEPAFDCVRQALALLVVEVDRVDSLAYRANNTASCLANGIQPD